MADVAEIVPESAAETRMEEATGTKVVSESVESKVVDEQGDKLPAPIEAAVDEAVKATSNQIDTSEKAVESCPAPAESTTECSTAEVAADTTDEASAGGVKRKSEEDNDSSEANDESKKVKTDDSDAKVESAEPVVSQSTEEPVVMNGGGAPESNGSHDAPDAATNGQTCDDIPPEKVTKTVEDVLKQPEDVAASS